MKFICDHCKEESEKYAGHINRSRRLGLNIYCSRICFGLSKRIERTDADKKKIKSDYDKERRVKLYDKIKVQRAEYFKKDYAANPEKYRAIRKAKYQKHLAYLRTPEYKEWKKNYDVKYRANKEYGEYGEAAVLLFELEDFLNKNMPPELKFQMGITNKTQKRKRLWQRAKKNYQQQT